MNNKLSGSDAENMFATEICKHGNFRTCFIDAHYDFDVWDDESKEKVAKVEVKSCHLFTKDANRKGKQHYRLGRFDFGNNLKLHKEENIFVCFVLYTDETNKVLLGVAKSTEIPQKRYISFSFLPKLKLMTIEQFTQHIRGTQWQPQQA